MYTPDPLKLVSVNFIHPSKPFLATILNSIVQINCSRFQLYVLAPIESRFWEKAIHSFVRRKTHQMCTPRRLSTAIHCRLVNSTFHHNLRLVRPRPRPPDVEYVLNEIRNFKKEKRKNYCTLTYLAILPNYFLLITLCWCTQKLFLCVLKFECLVGIRT